MVRSNPRQETGGQQEATASGKPETPGEVVDSSSCVILVDAGPLVALVYADDQFHKKCVATLKGLREPLVTDEREGIQKIFTVDRKGFTAYRLHGRVRPAIIP